jgi:hypothetical protein
MGAHVAQHNPETSADGIEFMDSTPRTLIAALEAIRDMAANALSQVGPSQGEHSMREMQRRSVHKAFYQACAPGKRWQMPAMQKYRVYAYSVRRVKSKALTE